MKRSGAEYIADAMLSTIDPGDLRNMRFSSQRERDKGIALFVADCIIVIAILIFIVTFMNARL